jgi:DNA-binding helix-hairpin-helix protein with protein kinase domain
MTVVSLIDVSGRQRRVILGRELHRGGAGGIHLVDADPSIVVKLYHAEALRSEGKIYAEKITCMLRSVPSVASSTAGMVQIAWPISMARDSAGNFLGFAMPVLDSKSTENLESLLQPKQAAVKQLRSDLGARVTRGTRLLI